MRWWLNLDALNKGDSMVLPHSKGPNGGTMETWVHDGNSWQKSTWTKTSKEARWCPKYKCQKWGNLILRRGEVTLLGQNVSWWSVRSQKINRYPFEGSVRAFQRCRRFGELSYSLAATSERKIRGFSFNKEFSLQIHSFSCGVVVDVERR